MRRSIDDGGGAPWSGAAVGERWPRLDMMPDATRTHPHRRLPFIRNGTECSTIGKFPFSSFRISHSQVCTEEILSDSQVCCSVRSHEVVVDLVELDLRWTDDADRCEDGEPRLGHEGVERLA